MNGFEELDLRKQIYAETPGSLGEAHIRILNELLANDPDNPGRCLCSRHVQLSIYRRSYVRKCVFPLVRRCSAAD